MTSLIRSIFFVSLVGIGIAVAAHALPTRGDDSDGLDPGPLPALIQKPGEQTAVAAGSRPVILAPPEAYHGSGPYRALYSRNAFAAIKASVSLPCNAAKVRPREELGYIYLGGWGAGTFGKAVDAGLQKGLVANGNPLEDYYNLIINYEGQWHTASPALRISCGQTVSLTFEADADGKLRLSTDAVKAISHDPTPKIVSTRELVEVAVKRGDGWLPNENRPRNGTLVKRMVTIGQPLCWFAKNPNGKGMKAIVSGWNSDGSYFGHHPGSSTPLIHWTSTQVGTYNPATQSWEWYTAAPDNVVRHDAFPAGDVHFSSQSDSEDEWAMIDLAGNSSPPSCRS
jgi:hypothetical protein